MLEKKFVCFIIGQGTIGHTSIASRNRLLLLWDVLCENKELLIGPALTLIPQLFSLPIFISSAAFVCRSIETTSLRYLIIVSWAASFIPQLTTFFLYISPSSFYKREWHATELSKWLHRVLSLHYQVPPTGATIFSITRDKTKPDFATKID